MIIEKETAVPAERAKVAAVYLNRLRLKMKLESGPALEVTAMKSPHPACERCWRALPDVGQDARHPTLCTRCLRAVSEE